MKPTKRIIYLRNRNPQIVSSPSDVPKNAKRRRDKIDIVDDALTVAEEASLKISLIEVDMIRDGLCQALSMNDLWTD